MISLCEVSVYYITGLYVWLTGLCVGYHRFMCVTSLVSVCDITGFCVADVDECSSVVLNTCDTLCENTVGGFQCSCRAGYQLNQQDGRTCEGDQRHTSHCTSTVLHSTHCTSTVLRSTHCTSVVLCYSNCSSIVVYSTHWTFMVLCTFHPLLYFILSLNFYGTSYLSLYCGCNQCGNDT